MHPYSQEISQQGTIPWNARYMDVGKGYDINTLQVLPSPFERSCSMLPKSPFDPSSSIQVAREVMRSETDLHSYRTACASASGIFAFLFSSKSSVESLKAAKCNATNMIAITRFTVTLAPEKLDEDALKLRPDAQDHLTRSPQDFLNIYGQYLITGTERQSTFMSVSRYRSTSSEALDTFQTNLGVGFQSKQVDASGAIEYAKGIHSKDSSITQSHDVSLSGYTSGNAAPLTFATMDVDGMLTDFLEQLSPVPQIAVLTHYSTLLPGKLSRPVTTRLPDDAAKLLHDCVMLQLRYQSNALVHAQHEATKLEGTTERLYANLMLSSNTSQTDVSSIREHIEASTRDCNMWQKRAAMRSAIEDEGKKKKE
jgi:hypothetical protein